MASLLSDRATTQIYLKIEEKIKRSSGILFVLFPQPKLFFSGQNANFSHFLAIFDAGKGEESPFKGENTSIFHILFSTLILSTEVEI